MIYKENIIEITGDSEEFYKNTPHRLLDIFPHSLSTEETENLSFKYKDLHFKNEFKQVDFFKQLFEDNKESLLIAEIPYKDMEEDEHIRILDELDRPEQHLWIKYMINTNIDQVTGFL